MFIAPKAHFQCGLGSDVGAGVMSVCVCVCYSWSCQSFLQPAHRNLLGMKIRDDILLVEQGMASVTAAPTDKWGVAYLQVAETHPPDWKISVVASV